MDDEFPEDTACELLINQTIYNIISVFILPQTSSADRGWHRAKTSGDTKTEEKEVSFRGSPENTAYN
jgi:hypothetical protein